MQLQPHLLTNWLVLTVSRSCRDPSKIKEQRSNIKDHRSTINQVWLVVQGALQSLNDVPRPALQSNLLGTGLSLSENC